MTTHISDHWLSKAILYSKVDKNLQKLKKIFFLSVLSIVSHHPSSSQKIELYKGSEGLWIRIMIREHTSNMDIENKCKK